MHREISKATIIPETTSRMHLNCITAFQRWHLVIKQLFENFYQLDTSKTQQSYKTITVVTFGRLYLQLEVWVAPPGLCYTVNIAHNINCIPITEMNYQNHTRVNSIWIINFNLVVIYVHTWQDDFEVQCRWILDWGGMWICDWYQAVNHRSAEVKLRAVH